jgi:hypothetical protein
MEYYMATHKTLNKAIFVLRRVYFRQAERLKTQLTADAVRPSAALESVSTSVIMGPIVRMFNPNRKVAK